MKNEEIKEILNKLKYIKNNPLINGEYDEENYLYSEEAKLLLKYITNLEEENENYRRLGFKHLAERNKKLQQENEMYKKELEKTDSITQSCIFECSRSAGKSYRQCLNWLEDYKSRCEKAMELLKLPIVYETHQENGERDELLKRIRQAENILNGSDEK